MTGLIYLVDDDEEMINSLTFLLESVNYQVKSYPSAQNFLDAYQASDEQADHNVCLVLDVCMPDMTGLELQDKLKLLKINIPLIFMSAYAEVAISVRAMKRGAEDFLIKPANSQELLESINNAILKQNDQAEQQKKYQEVLALVAKLTPREKEVMALVTTGMPTKLIADKLNISVNTAEAHRNKVIKKMNERSAAGVIYKVTKYNVL